MGYLITFAISYLPMPLSGIFATEYFVVNSTAWHYVQAVIAAIIIVMIACFAPSRKAGKLVPGDVIRGTAA
jgi:lipoprotein-releasing system permease protein